MLCMLYYECCVVYMTYIDHIWVYFTGVAMEYKVHVDAAKEDCYYQYVHPGATLYVSQQVRKTY